jgi:hypothetical protein
VYGEERGLGLGWKGGGQAVNVIIISQQSRSVSSSITMPSVSFIHYHDAALMPLPGFA